MLSKEQIAHDLSIAYINNRYGVDVTGQFNVSGSDGDISGSGDVNTEHLPDVDEIKRIKIGTGEKGLFGFEKKKWAESGFLIDDIFVNMINDYQKAYSRFLELLSK